jgi:hypothetical protein
MAVKTADTTASADATASQFASVKAACVSGAHLDCFVIYCLASGEAMTGADATATANATVMADAYFECAFGLFCHLLPRLPLANDGCGRNRECESNRDFGVFRVRIWFVLSFIASPPAWQ